MRSLCFTFCSLENCGGGGSNARSLLEPVRCSSWNRQSGAARWLADACFQSVRRGRASFVRYVLCCAVCAGGRCWNGTSVPMARRKNRERGGVRCIEDAQLCMGQREGNRRNRVPVEGLGLAFLAAWLRGTISAGRSCWPGWGEKWYSSADGGRLRDRSLAMDFGGLSHTAGSLANTTGEGQCTTIKLLRFLSSATY
jgi:hypothetical protein